MEHTRGARKIHIEPKKRIIYIQQSRKHLESRTEEEISKYIKKEEEWKGYEVKFYSESQGIEIQEYILSEIR